MKKENVNVQAVAKAVREMGREATYAEVCAYAGTDFGPGVFTQAVKQKLIGSRDAAFKCDLVRQSDGLKVGETTKRAKVYFAVAETEPAEKAD